MVGLERCCVGSHDGLDNMMGWMGGLDGVGFLTLPEEVDVGSSLTGM